MAPYFLQERPAFYRYGALIGIGLILVAASLFWRASKRPQPAPPDVQKEGYQIISQTLEQLATTPHCRDRRGALLFQQAQNFLKTDRIIFSSSLGQPRGITWSEIGGRRIIYVKVLERTGGRYLHQTPGQIMEVLFHEAIHALKGGFQPTSFEEECDGFIAGMDVQSVVDHKPIPKVLSIDGLPLGHFIRLHYPQAAGNPEYEPVGQDRDWLMERSGETFPDNS